MSVTRTSTSDGRDLVAVTGDALPPTGDRVYLRPEEAADRYRTSVESLRRWTAEGRLRAFRFGDRGRRYLVSDLEALMVPIEPGADSDADDE